MLGSLVPRSVPSYSPEAIELARRPVFNTDATSIFDKGVVTPKDLEAVDTTVKIKLPDQAPKAVVDLGTGTAAAGAGGTSTPATGA